jgi:hypothetical protein
MSLEQPSPPRLRTLAIPLAFLISCTSLQAVRGQDETSGTFREGRTGEIPEGADELLTDGIRNTIDAGLRWLAGHQGADGSYGSGSYRIAVTSLSGLAFMASGSSPGRGPYGGEIDKALGFILSCTDDAGFINCAPPSNNPMYGHGFGALFLAEAYGMTRRPEIREKLERAVRLIIDTQNAEGGWRYQPVKGDADLSVTICQINALRAARNAGLFIPRETVEACIDYVKRAQNPDGGFRYMIRPGASAFPRSAAGVVALYSAAIYEDQAVDAGIDYVKSNRPPSQYKGQQPHFYYGHYYAIQAMWIRGGDDWLRWYPAIRDELEEYQEADGSWPDGFGPAYGTSMALLILQMPRTSLPIFQR